MINSIHAQSVEVRVPFRQKRQLKLQVTDFLQRADLSKVLTFGAEGDPIVEQINLVDHYAQILYIH